MLKRFLRGGSDESLQRAEQVMLIAIGVLIVALLAGQVAHLRSSNRDKSRKADLYEIQLSLQKYYALNGYYPRSLSVLSDLPKSACSDPNHAGDCTNPSYVYKAFSDKTKPIASGSSNCNNRQVMCAGYVIYSTHMETTANPYVLASN